MTDVREALRVIAEHDPMAAAAWEAFLQVYAAGRGRVEMVIMGCETTPLEQWDWWGLQMWSTMELPSAVR